MANFYCTRDAVKLAGSLNGASFDARIDRIIEGVSRRTERTTRRFYIPQTLTRLYRWPPPDFFSPSILYLDADLLSVTTLQAKAQDSSPMTISSSDYFLEPNNLGPPYSSIEIDLSSTSAFRVHV